MIAELLAKMIERHSEELETLVPLGKNFRDGYREYGSRNMLWYQQRLKNGTLTSRAVSNVE